MTAEYLGPSEGVDFTWSVPTWGTLRIYRVALRQCEAGESSRDFGPYICVSSPDQALVPPPACPAPQTAADGRPCTYTLWRELPSSFGGTSDRALGSRGAIFWYLARGRDDELLGVNDSMFVAISEPQQVTYFGTPDPPETPADFTATAISETAIRLTWQPTPTASGYELEQFENCTWDGGVLPFTDFEFTYEGLQPNTTYQFRIRSVNEHGASLYASASATTGDVTPPGCDDFTLRLDFNPVQVAAGGADAIGVFVDRNSGFADQVDLAVTAGPNGTQPNDVLSQSSFNPNPLDGNASATTLSFNVREDLTVGQSYDLTISGASPFLETDPEWCVIPIAFEVVQ